VALTEAGLGVVLSPHRPLAVNDASHVAEVRREALGLSTALGLGETASGKLAIAVTEGATNLLKHAGGGQIVLRPLERSGVVGVEVLVLDQGPGMANPGESLRDGFSTAGSPGHGMGALSRMTTAFQMHTQPGKGTALRFEIWGQQPTDSSERLIAGAVCVAKKGEHVSGDGWALHAERGRYALVIVDGLGHGPDAARAASVALTAVRRRLERGSSEQIEAIHDALRVTRGAAAAVAVMEPVVETLAFCGVGNISGVIRHQGTSRHCVSHNGTLGHQLRKVQEFNLPFPHGALLIAHSDGVATHWNLADYPGLETRHPGLIAGVLYRDHFRERDDATVVVIRNNARAGV
jgi:anti-sigma regulatory factor (Ser/Thr protein kinase)